MPKRQRGSRHDFPESAHLIRDYNRMKEIAAAFAAAKIKLLVVLGSSGLGKGQIVRQAMWTQQPSHDNEFLKALIVALNNTLARLSEEPPQKEVSLGQGLYVKGKTSPIDFHISAYKHRDAPICIDDADAFFSDKELREATKHISETDQYKLMAHRTRSNILLEAGVPKEFWTTSPVCIIRNEWDSDDIINQAIQSRGTFVVFDPTWSEVYKYIGSWFWDQEIFDYLWERLPLLKKPDIRIVMKAFDTKQAAIPGFDWRQEIDRHIADQSHRLMSEFLQRQFPNEQARINAWIEAVKADDQSATASRATWFRIKKEIESKLGEGNPERIILQRTERPIERRPFDSSIVEAESGTKGGVEEVAALRDG